MAEGTVTMYDKVSPSVVPLTGTREPVEWLQLPSSEFEGR